LSITAEFCVWRRKRWKGLPLGGNSEFTWWVHEKHAAQREGLKLIPLYIKHFIAVFACKLFRYQYLLSYSKNEYPYAVRPYVCIQEFFSSNLDVGQFTSHTGGDFLCFSSFATINCVIYPRLGHGRLLPYPYLPFSLTQMRSLHKKSTRINHYVGAFQCL
jgi:hypothetical protein